MVCYVAVPSSLIGINKPTISRRDKLTAHAVSGALGAAVSTPPYMLGRIGILMLGSHALFIPGIVVVAVGFALQAGATGAVKAVKLSAHLVAGGASTSDAGAAAARRGRAATVRRAAVSGGVRRGARCAGPLCVIRTSFAPIVTG